MSTALEGAAGAGADTQLLDMREADLPMYEPDDDRPTEAASKQIESCYEADGMLWSGPIYQDTISGPFRNGLDQLHLPNDRDPPAEELDQSES